MTGAMFLFTAVGMLVAAATEVAPAPAEWTWEPDAEACILYQTADGTYEQFSLQRYPATNQTAIIMANMRVTGAREQVITGVKVTLEPSGEALADGRIDVASPNNNPILILTIRDPNFLTAFEKSQAINVSHRAIGKWRQVLRFTGPAAQALRDCEARKLLNPAISQAPESQPQPIEDLGKVFTEDDYPPGYALEGIGGKIDLALTIAADGTVARCAATNARADKYFAQKLCAVFKRRARFRPARDAHGKAVSGLYLQTFEFSVER